MYATYKVKDIVKMIKNHSTSCIGHLEPEQLLDIVGLQPRIKKDKLYIPELRNKIIVDFGAWVSDFASHILNVSTPKRIVTVDTMYETEESFTIFLNETRLHMERILEDLDKEPESPTKDYKQQIRHRQMSLIKSAKFTDESSVKRSTSIDNLPKNICDYMFMSDVFVSLEDPFRTLIDISRILKPKWKLYITESQWNIKVDPECIDVFKRDVFEGHQGIKVIYEDPLTLWIEMSGVYLKKIQTDFTPSPSS